MSEATFTFRVDSELKAAFAEAAKNQDRTGAQLLRDYMREVVRRQREDEAYDVRFRRAVALGLDAAEAGDLVSADEVEAEAETWRAEMRRKLSGSPS